MSSKEDDGWHVYLAHKSDVDRTATMDLSPGERWRLALERTPTETIERFLSSGRPLNLKFRDIARDVAEGRDRWWR